MYCTVMLKLYKADHKYINGQCEYHCMKLSQNSIIYHDNRSRHGENTNAF